jgi:hypothetical protein
MRSKNSNKHWCLGVWNCQWVKIDFLFHQLLPAATMSNANSNLSEEQKIVVDAVLSVVRAFDIKSTEELAALALAFSIGACLKISHLEDRLEKLESDMTRMKNDKNC